jgi:hypothetical protein
VGEEPLLFLERLIEPLPNILPVAGVCNVVLEIEIIKGKIDK